MKNKEKNSKAMMDLYYSRKKHLIGLMGGECYKCGSTAADLEFDHIEPEEKIKNITSLFTGKLNILLDEAKKCQLLCNSCHKKKNKIDVGEAKHGSISMYRHHKCRCSDCKIAWNLSCAKWKKKYRNKNIEESSNGKTQVFGPCNFGSNPNSSTIQESYNGSTFASEANNRGPNPCS